MEYRNYFHLINCIFITERFLSNNEGRSSIPSTLVRTGYIQECNFQGTGIVGTEPSLFSQVI